jgi:leader peptidase (prepilin peptidase)/N-methyltransferase
MQLSAFPAWFAGYLVFVAFACGAVAGSALECLAWRIVHREPWAGGRSHCPACGHTLGFFDLIPVFSWLALRGRCRYCGARIGAQHVLCEALMGGAFVCLLARFGVGIALLRGLVFTCMLFPAALCDLSTFEIPDRFAAIGAAAWALLLPFSPEGWRSTLFSGLLGAAAVAAGVWLVSKALEKRMGCETMGGGDIKLYALAGLYLGAAANLLNVLVSCILGLLFSALARRLSAKGAGAETPDDLPAGAFPFGPAIALSSWLCLLAGQALIGWYWHLFV